MRMFFVFAVVVVPDAKTVKGKDGILRCKRPLFIA